ncbi:hypothetical protein HK101_003938, partial [Irineochytrium annulatum]
MPPPRPPDLAALPVDVEDPWATDDQTEDPFADESTTFPGDGGAFTTSPPLFPDAPPSSSPSQPAAPANDAYTDCLALRDLYEATASHSAWSVDTGWTTLLAGNMSADGGGGGVNG